MRYAFVALVTTIALPGMLEALRQGGHHQSEEDSDTSALLQTARSTVNREILRPTSLLREKSEEQSQCRLVLPLLDGEGNDEEKLQSLCQKTFSNLACQDARNALAERPWSMDAVGEACSHLGSPAGVWRNHDVNMESALFLRQRSTLRFAERDKLRQQLDSSLKRKGQDYVKQPPYTTAVTTTPPVGAATTTSLYFGESATPYKANPNPVFEDATVWCGNSSVVKGRNCTPTEPPSSTHEVSVTTSVSAKTTAVATTSVAATTSAVATTSAAATSTAMATTVATSTVAAV